MTPTTSITCKTAGSPSDLIPWGFRSSCHERYPPDFNLESADLLAFTPSLHPKISQPGASWELRPTHLALPPSPTAQPISPRGNSIARGPFAINSPNSFHELTSTHFFV